MHWATPPVNDARGPRSRQGASAGAAGRFRRHACPKMLARKRKMHARKRMGGPREPPTRSRCRSGPGPVRSGDTTCSGIARAAATSRLRFPDGARTAGAPSSRAPACCVTARSPSPSPSSGSRAKSTRTGFFQGSWTTAAAMAAARRRSGRSTALPARCWTGTGGAARSSVPRSARPGPASGRHQISSCPW